MGNIHNAVAEDDDDCDEEGDDSNGIGSLLETPLKPLDPFGPFAPIPDFVEEEDEEGAGDDTGDD